MRVWIDITNSPHVRFFAPLIAELEARGHEVSVTAREYAQTRDLLEQAGIVYTLTGHHRGRSLVRKAWGLVARTFALVQFARDKEFDVAFSHASNDLAVAAWLLRIPHMMVHDYEHANLSYAVNARLSSRILVPEAIGTGPVVAHGARVERVGTFPGLKEHVYLDEAIRAAADGPGLRRQLGIRDEEVFIVARTPATMSAYHRFENECFDAVLDRLVSTPGARVLALPRSDGQADALRERYGERVIVPRHPIEGTALVVAADLVLSAGGTMNREAAVLGTPAYTVFAGAMGAVDAFLIARGLLVQVHEPLDVLVKRRPHSAGYFVSNRDVILAELEALASARGRAGDRSRIKA